MKTHLADPQFAIIDRVMQRSAHVHFLINVNGAIDSDHPAFKAWSEALFDYWDMLRRVTAQRPESGTETLADFPIPEHWDTDGLGDCVQ